MARSVLKVTANVYFDTTDPQGFVDALGGTGHMFEDVKGFHGFRLARGIKDPSRYLLTVDWDSMDDHVAWQKGYVGDFLEALGDHISGAPDISHFE